MLVRCVSRDQVGNGDPSRRRDRSGRTIRPLHQARSAAEAAELALAELGGLERGTLTLAASQTIASYWLPRHMVTFRRVHPGITVRLIIGNTLQVATAVRD
jgi:DNA-binding transcriptional LysR family regulator